MRQTERWRACASGGGGGGGGRGEVRGANTMFTYRAVLSLPVQPFRLPQALPAEC